MNKLFVVLLAVCLVSCSVNAYVKRDAPEGPDFQKLQEQIQGLAKSVSEKLSEAFKPEQIKKGFDDFVDNIKSITEKKPEAAAPKE